MQKLLSFLLLYVLCVPIAAQDPEYYNDRYLRYEDYTYRPTIKTVILQQEGTDGSLPLIELGSDTRLQLQFDDLDPVQRQLYYSIEHCNADWTPSNVMKSRTVQGLQQDLLQDFRYSFNTRQQYLHYSLSLPNDNMKILLSGNYLLKVYEDGDPENLVLTRRFMVFTTQAKVSARIKRPSLMNLRDTHQEIDALVDVSAVQITNAPSAVKLVIRQNNRWDNAIWLKPFSVNSQSITYDYDDGSNCFPGGNEYRWVDVRSLRMQSDRVKKLNRDSVLVEVQLLDDPVRAFSSYRSLPEANGRFFIRNQEGSEPEVDGDYCWVDFSLPFEAPVVNGNLYLFGSLCDWQFKKDFKPSYDYPNKSYRTRILLKQGIYNYSYIFAPSKGGPGDETYIEGSFFNTENDYQILFYNRAYTETFDELIGISQVNSIRNQ
ncbi:MAG: hypothetical protein RLZZ543_1435 [Bacteroidota bacterium]